MSLSGRFRFQPLDGERAIAIVGWRYSGPYAVYNLGEEAVRVLADPANAYFSVDDATTGDLIGFCCFGPEARVSGGTYSDSTGLDVGVGLRPDITGRGVGATLIRAVLELGTESYRVHHFGATVAACNERALRATMRAGFHVTREFAQPESGRLWKQLEIVLTG